jgi:hypothetical protein
MGRKKKKKKKNNSAPVHRRLFLTLDLDSSVLGRMEIFSAKYIWSRSQVVYDQSEHAIRKHPFKQDGPERM